MEPQEDWQDGSLSSPRGSTSSQGSLSASPACQVSSVRFNQDGTCFACGTDAGMRVYHCDPFKEQVRRNFGVVLNKSSQLSCEFGGIGHAEMLFRCNLFAVVGGGEFPCFPPEKVLIWDDHQCKCIGELGFHTKVLAVRLRRDRVVVSLKSKVFVYSFKDLKQLQRFETADNPLGLLALSPQEGRAVLACPGLQPGQVRVEHLDFRRTHFITGAHASALGCLALSQDGELLASSSEKGTLVRVWETHPRKDGQGFLQQELRRGSDRADIFSIAFSPSKQWLAASSSKGTVHVWPLGEGAAGGKAEAPSMTLGSWATGGLSRLASGLVPQYFHSKWSFAQYRLGDSSRSTVTFGAKDNLLIVVTCSGRFHKVQFNARTGGECTKVSFCRFS